MKPSDPFDTRMSDEEFDAYLQLCKEVFLEMQRAGTWPWLESQNSENLIESNDT